jgi:hypothetical protein
MKRDYGMAPEADHIMHLVDLIARAGDLWKVEAIFARLSIQSSATIWLSLLGACQRHGNVSLGKKAFERVLELQPNEDLAYVLMSNIYGDATVVEKPELVVRPIEGTICCGLIRAWMGNLFSSSFDAFWFVDMTAKGIWVKEIMRMGTLSRLLNSFLTLGVS